MRVLFLSEGDPESSVGSFSGSSKSLVDHIRLAGHTVMAADVDLYGVARLLAAAPLFSPSRSRWSVRFHSHRWPSFLRSLNAAREISLHPQADLILQTGATFAPFGRGNRPYFLYCDSNMMMAARGAATGFSWAAHLSSQELDAVTERELAVYRGAAGIFTISEYLRRSFLDDVGIDQARVVTVGAGPNIDASEFSPRREPSCVSDVPTILFVGVHFERKGGDILLEAFRRVRQELPRARLLIVGPKDRPSMDPGVEWLGFLRKDTPQGRAALLKAYAAADVFCLPTRYEPFGIAFLEAMFSGLPCIGTNVWAVPEMVRDCETGYLVQPDDAPALAGRLLTILQDPAVAHRLGSTGRTLAERQFTWKATTARMVEFMMRHSSGE